MNKLGINTDRGPSVTIDFIPASMLKKQFDVRGHFYSLVTSSAEPLPCRSVLEIKSSSAPPRMEADAVFVMMNPGSSKPFNEVEHLIDSACIAAMPYQLVPTLPDTTQYQVMRIMHHAGWEYVRVLNLSDMRDPKSKSFARSYLQFEQQTGCRLHSIFAPDRSEELQRNLSRKPSGPIVCAWGVSDDLDPLIGRAMSSLSKETVIAGLAKPAQPGKYFHPLPTPQHRKELWVAQMLDQLAARH